MSIRNLFFRESECKKPSDSPFPCGLRASHPFCGLPRFASQASGCASAARRARPRCFAPFLRPAPLRVAGFGLRFRCAACSSSVLRTLFAACPALRRGLRTAVALSGLSSSSVLRTLFGGPPRFASQASDCASAARRARPRCFAPFWAARPALRRGLRTALPLRGVLALGASHPFCGLPRFASRASDCGSPFRAVLVLGASHPFWRPAPLCVAGFGLRFRCAACSSSVLRTLFGKQKPRTEARGVMIPFWFPCFENQR